MINILSLSLVFLLGLTPLAVRGQTTYEACAQPQQVFRPDTGPITAAVFVSAGKALVTATGTPAKQGNLLTWDVASGKRLATLEGLTHGVYSLAAGHGGNLVASGSDSQVLVHDASNRRQVGRFPETGGRIHALAFSPDDLLLAAGGEGGMIHVYDLSAGNKLTSWKAHQDVVTSLAFAPGGKTLASASFDGLVRLWTRPETQKTGGPAWSREKSLGTGASRAHSVAFSPDGKRLAAGFSGTAQSFAVPETERAQVLLWKLEDTRSPLRLSGTGKDFTAVCFSPTDPLLAAASSDGTLRTWNLEGRPLATLRAHDSWITSLVFAPSGATILSTSWDPEARLWDLPRWKLVNSAAEISAVPRELVYEPRARLLAGACGDRFIRVWHAETLKPGPQLQGQIELVGALAVSPDGSLLAASSGAQADGTKGGPIAIWNLSNNKEEKLLQGHQGPVAGLSFSPDGRLLASGGDDKSVRLWSLPSGEERLQLLGHTTRVRRIAFHPDGKTLASGGDDGAIHLWDVETGQDKKVLTGPQRSLTGLIFTPDGSHLVACFGAELSQREPVSVLTANAMCWDVASWEPRWQTTKRGESYVAIAYSPGEKLVAVRGFTYAREGLVGFVRFLQADTGRERVVLRLFSGSNTNMANAACFINGGKKLVGAYPSAKATLGEMQVWSLPGIAKIP